MLMAFRLSRSPGSVRALMRDLKGRNIVSRQRLLKTGVIRGGVPFGCGALFFPLRNRFYVDEISYKGQIYPGEQPPPSLIAICSIWPAAGFVDTEIRCLTELESGNAEKEVQPRVQA